MLRSMYSAISGMHAFQTQLDVISNNIANVDTPGFKAGRADFSDILSQTINSGNAPGNGLGGTNPQQVGLGVQVGAIATLFTQGAPETTNNPTDLAIQGNGLFIVDVGGGNQYYTRAGNFSLDDSGNLVLPSGAKLMGYAYTNGAFSNTPTDIQIPPTQYTDVSVGLDGTVTAIDKNNNTRTTIAKVALAMFNNPAGLEKVGNTMYQVSPNSGPATAVQPQTSGAGMIQSGALEMSNVDLTQEFSNMIIAQRGFDANSKVIGTDNAILNDIVNLKNS
ncbi:flagellar hook-basal body complex protein [Alicyclobacillus herbarius]|uniref:flagellar hook-basal body complex protein n=1 Tax=Alicyclobacillus herbarius TaxID=122960 RepID=UPI00040F590D|nr:flagellar hook-basal body complex protein [Alicyclobacillus herbarius]